MTVRRWFALALVLSVFALTGAAAQAQESGTKVHALTLQDAPKYGPDFKHLDYVNPDAPKGGTITYSAIGTFDSFNPFIVTGTPASLPGLFETLTTRTDDDELTGYGLIAESMEIAPDKSWIIFNLRQEARWHDGKPITADDVVFSFNMLKEFNPQLHQYYANVVKAEALEEHRVKFTFDSGGNRELPAIMGELPVLPKHWWEGRKFDEVLREPPLGSGPYKLGKYDMGRSFTMERVPDYWGKDLPINIGTDNFDRQIVTYFRDPEIAFEAFKAGRIDIRPNENSAKRWATQYEFPAIKDGRVKKEVIPHDQPVGMQGFVFNTRRDIFADRKVREAIGYAFDFEWENKTLFFGQYTRTRSYYQNSEMAATGLPSPEELEILNPLKGQIPDEVFTTEYNPPKSDGSGNNRDNLGKAAQLLEEAGWKVENGKRVKDGKPLAFEILLDDAAFERVMQPFINSLQLIGVTATMRTLQDASQYEARTENFDFDMLVGGWGETLSPGNEQRGFWTSASADEKGSQNFAGIKDPAIDKLVDLIIHTPSRKDLIIRCRALDRVLQWNYFVVPNFHLAAYRLAYWDKFTHPAKRPDPLFGEGLSSWWIDPQKAKTIEASKTAEAGTTDAQAAPQSQTQQQAPAPTTQPAAPAPTESAPADRGRSPIIYGVGAIIVVIVAFLLGKRRRKS
ncbi:MAG TPA: ABC transporter substrate-binding protein [Dongiaceae bacterium]|jgi:microcin C transport system substrate-binding protein|nr:ABC transporter substrate-binding protein [Dongiaceae bacterium]